MNSPHWHRRALALPFLVLLIGAFIGGQLNRVDAHGRIIDDTSGSPVPGVTVSFGSRAVVTGDDGTYALDNLPRGARLDTKHHYYGRHSVDAGAAELRIEPLAITFEVKDAASAKGVDTPEARQPADTQIGKGTVSGEMVVGPYPRRDAPVIICAKNYQSREITPAGYQMDVLLTASQGAECPPLKSPPPAQVPSPSPSASPSASGSPAPSPSPTP